MLITKKIKIKINKGNLGYYNKAMNTKYKIGDEIDVPIEFIPKTMKIKVIVSCDICKRENEISYVSYNKSLKYGFYSCNKCKHIKRKKTNLEKYKDENFNNFDKRLNTMFKLYGKFNNNSDKRKNTLIEKYGVDNISKLEKIKLLKEQINLKNWGVKNVFENDEIKEKIKKTNLKKYGVEHNSQSEEVKNKKIKTCNKNHGVDYPSQSKEIIFKIKQTNLKNLGVDSFSKTNNFKEIIKNGEFRKKYKIENDINYLKYLGNSISLFKCDVGKDHKFEITSELYHARKTNNIPLCVICNPIGELRSIKEKEFFEFILSVYSGNIIQNYRDVFEIDIYLPELKLGFEFNGLYWHSNKFKNNLYHLNKTLYFKEKDIRIINIWEDDWIYKKEIIKSQILYLLKKIPTKIYARNCEIRELTNSKTVSNFLNNNHILGSAGSNIKIGLFYNDDLVSLMTFNNIEGRKKMNSNCWNISRFCNKLNTTVMGGASKLLKHFISKYNPKKIISYADYSSSDGKLYETLGFKIINKTYPDYKYIVNNKRIHKSNFKKEKIGIKDKKITEKEYMEKNNIYRIYDCGKIKYCIEF